MDGGFKYEKEQGLFNKRSWLKGYDVIWAVGSKAYAPDKIPLHTRRRINRTARSKSNDGGSLLP
jgi:hypothetical protein